MVLFLGIARRFAPRDPWLGGRQKTWNASASRFFFISTRFWKQAFNARENKKAPNGAFHVFCGEGGIRTLDTSLSSYNGLANRPFRPLRHLSILSLTRNAERKTVNRPPL